MPKSLAISFLAIAASALLVSGCGGETSPDPLPARRTLKSVSINSSTGAIQAVTRVTLDRVSRVALLEFTLASAPPDTSKLLLTLPLRPSGQEVKYTVPFEKWAKQTGGTQRFTSTVRLDQPDPPFVPSSTLVRDMIAWLETGRGEVDFDLAANGALVGGVGATVLRSDSALVDALKDMVILQSDQSTLKFDIELSLSGPLQDRRAVRARLEAWPPNSPFIGTPSAVLSLTPRVTNLGVTRITETVTLDFLTGTQLDTTTNRLIGLIYSGRCRIVFDMDNGTDYAIDLARIP